MPIFSHKTSVLHKTVHILVIVLFYYILLLEMLRHMAQAVNKRVHLPYQWINYE